MNAAGIRNEAFAYNPSFFELLDNPIGSSSTMNETMKLVKQSGYRTIVLSLETPTLELPLLAVAAVEAGLTNGDYVWMFFGDQDPTLWFSSDENLRAIQRGSQWITPVDPFLLDQNDTFLLAWRSRDLQAVQNAIFANPIRPGQPGYLLTNESYFQDYFPDLGASFIYDAVMATGIGACRAYSYMKENNITSSSSSEDSASRPLVPTDLHVNGIRQSRFTGASGDVVEFGSDEGQRDSAARNGSSLIWAILNLLPPLPNGTDSGEILEIPRLRFESQWYPYGSSDLVYADGRTEPPELLRDEPDMNYLATSLRSVGFALMGMIILMSMGCAGWTLIHRADKIVRQSQPIFLYILCFGTITAVLSILTISFDESYGWSQTQLNRACMATPWLLSSGHIITYGSLFSKLWRINRVLQFTRRKIEVKHVAWPMIIVMISTLAILSFWTAFDPMQWQRKEINSDTGESIGQCDCDNLVAWTVSIVFLMLIPTLLTLLMAWKTKDVDSSYSESKWIFIMVVVQLEVIFVAIPLIAILRDVSTDGRYLGFAFMIWMFPATSLGLIFIPKIIADYRSRKGTTEMQTKKRGERNSGDNVHISGLNPNVGTSTNYSSSVSRYAMPSGHSTDSYRNLVPQATSPQSSLNDISSSSSTAIVALNNTSRSQSGFESTGADRGTLMSVLSDIPNEMDDEPSSCNDDTVYDVATPDTEDHHYHNYPGIDDTIEEAPPVVEESLPMPTYALAEQFPDSNPTTRTDGEQFKDEVDEDDDDKSATQTQTKN
jgi:hypothetical protein